MVGYLYFQHGNSIWLGMPNHEEHCQHSFQRYGVRGDEIHAWMDEPSSVAGTSHRDFRHDLSSLPTAIQLFGKAYGAEMVENIFLDHLKADSEEHRRREQESDESLKPKLWSKSDDDFLCGKFLDLSDEALEASLQTKSKTAIRKRREYLGLIRPRIIKRNRDQPRIQRLVFKLQRGQRIFGTVEVTGGNNDVDFGFFTYQGASVSTLRPANIERISGSKSFAHNISVSGNYCFYFSNSFSVVTSKAVEFHYHLENGQDIGISFTI